MCCKYCIPSTLTALIGQCTNIVKLPCLVVTACELFLCRFSALGCLTVRMTYFRSATTWSWMNWTLFWMTSCHLCDDGNVFLHHKNYDVVNVNLWRITLCVHSVYCLLCFVVLSLFHILRLVVLVSITACSCVWSSLVDSCTEPLTDRIGSKGLKAASCQKLGKTCVKGKTLGKTQDGLNMCRIAF